jgi:lipopolysaccharide transport system ATP-binding protein
MDEKVILQVEDISKKFCGDLGKSLWYGIQDVGAEFFLRSGCRAELRQGEFWALKDVSFNLHRGEALGLIGKNGAGKTSLLRLLGGLIKPDRGSIIIQGRTAALIELGAGFNPVLTGRENIYVNGALLGMTKKDMERVLDDIIDFAEVGDFIDSPLQSYSAGMRLRLGFSVAAHINPSLLIVDEVLAVGDMGFQRKCLQYATRYLGSGGSLVLVSHNMHVIQSICQRCVFLDRGEVRCEGTTSEAIEAYIRFQNSVGIESSGIRQEMNGSCEPILIEGVEVVPLEGTGIRSGQGLRLTLHYESRHELPPVTWGFSIWTKDLETRITTCVAKYANQEHRLREGKGHLSCVLSNLPLVPGVYALRSGIYDIQTAWPLSRIGWENSPIFFSVQGSIDEANVRHSVDGDIVTVDVKWDE